MAHWQMMSGTGPITVVPMYAAPHNYYGQYPMVSPAQLPPHGQAQGPTTPTPAQQVSHSGTAGFESPLFSLQSGCLSWLCELQSAWCATAAGAFPDAAPCTNRLAVALRASAFCSTGRIVNATGGAECSHAARVLQPTPFRLSAHRYSHLSFPCLHCNLGLGGAVIRVSFHLTRCYG